MRRAALGLCQRPLSDIGRYIGVFGKAQNESKAGGNAEAMAMTAPVVSKIDAKRPEPEAMAMTAPVVSKTSETGAERMSFLLPGSYTLDTAPTPKEYELLFFVISPDQCTYLVVFATVALLFDAAKG